MTVHHQLTAGATLSVLLLAPASGWVTQMQSKYGVQPIDVANAWDGNETNPGSYGTMGYYWHWPAEADDNRGLGGGIAWAWDDELCKETTTKEYDWFESTIFEDTFEEDFFFTKFVVCKDLRAAMHRAFQTWSDMRGFGWQKMAIAMRRALRRGGPAADSPGRDSCACRHQHINFIDVTEECRRIYGRVQSNCSLVEVFVTFRNDGGIAPTAGRPWPWDSGASGDPYPYGDPYAVTSFPGGVWGRRLSELLSPSPPPPILDTESDISSGTAAASASQYGRYADDLRSTNGHVQVINNGDGTTRPRTVIEAVGGIISFNIDKCWYLDSAFCSPLHTLKNTMGATQSRAMIQGLAFGIFSIAGLLSIFLLFQVCKHQHGCFCFHDERTVSQKSFETLEELNSWGVLPLMCLLLALWVPISFQVNVVEPCWSCYDFEAAAVHEIGHILGLNHPDAIGTIAGYPEGSNSHNTLLADPDGVKSYLTPGLPADACTNPWKYVVSGAFDDGELVEESLVRNSIMEAFTEHNPRVCLTPDDMEGLVVLYPVCTGRGMTVETSKDWNCGKSKQHIGWVRVLVYIFVPVMVIMLVEMLILSRLKHHEEHKLEKKDAQINEHKVEAEKHQKTAAKHAKRASLAQEALELQVATEESRIEERAHELAAAKIQAHLRRKKSAGQVLKLKKSRDQLEAAGQKVNHGETYQVPASMRGSERKPGGLPPASKPGVRTVSISAAQPGVVPV